jgi:D-erythrose 4-phosphate dehydrogenase
MVLAFWATIPATRRAMSVRLPLRALVASAARSCARPTKRDAAIKIVAITEITDVATLAALLRHDSVYGRFPGTIEEGDRALVIDGNEVRVLAEPDPAKLPWGELGIDVVMECTGRIRTRPGRPSISRPALRR